MAGRRVVERVTIDAPVDRVWRALCDPDEVRTWDGARPLSVPPDYPVAGQHARWRTTLGAVPVVLHDRVQTVEPGTTLAARITYGFVDIDEEYRLTIDRSRTTLTSDNLVRARVPGLGPVAARLVQRSVRSALDRLAAHCAQDLQ